MFRSHVFSKNCSSYSFSPASSRLDVHSSSTCRRGAPVLAPDWTRPAGSEWNGGTARPAYGFHVEPDPDNGVILAPITTFV